MKILRWLLVAPAAIVAWCTIFFLSIFTYVRVEKLLCPRGQMLSFGCADGSVIHTMQALEVFFVALSAVAVVGAAAAMAPAHRGRVAWVAFCGGAIVAVYFVTETGAYAEGAAAIGAGLITAMLIARRRARSVQPVAA